MHIQQAAEVVVKVPVEFTEGPERVPCRKEEGEFATFFNLSNVRTKKFGFSNFLIESTFNFHKRIEIMKMSYT